MRRHGVPLTTEVVPPLEGVPPRIDTSVVLPAAGFQKASSKPGKHPPTADRKAALRRSAKSPKPAAISSTEEGLDCRALAAVRGSLLGEASCGERSCTAPCDLEASNLARGKTPVVPDHGSRMAASTSAKVPPSLQTDESIMPPVTLQCNRQSRSSQAAGGSSMLGARGTPLGTPRSSLATPVLDAPVRVRSSQGAASFSSRTSTSRGAMRAMDPRMRFLTTTF